MPARCCPECFDDRGLRRSIIPALAPTHGTCDFCGSLDVDLVDPKQLADYFELLANVYEADPGGKPLVEWMKEDWQLFTHARMDSAHAKELLSKILNDGEVVRKNFSPSALYKSEGLARWETLRDELMYKNRYFLDETLDIDRLKELLLSSR